MHVHPAAAGREERVRRSRLGGRKPAAPEEGRESRSHTFVVSRGRLRRASLMRRGEASWAAAAVPAAAKACGARRRCGRAAATRSSSRGRLRRASFMRRGEASWASSNEPGGAPPPLDPPGRLWRAPLARGATRKAPPARQSDRSPFCLRPGGGAPPWLFARATKGPAALRAARKKQVTATLLTNEASCCGRSPSRVIHASLQQKCRGSPG